MKVLIVLISILMIFSCKENLEELSPKEYIEWIENPDNGLVMEKEIGGIKFQLQYKPAEYIAIKEMDGKIQEQDVEKIFKEKVRELEGMEHFNFQMQGKDKSTEVLRVGTLSEDDYLNRVNYFSTLAQKDFIMKAGKDTVACELYHFERSYNVAPFSRIVLGFPSDKINKEEDHIISYQDETFKIGNINFTMESATLRKIPRIKF